MRTDKQRRIVAGALVVFLALTTLAAAGWQIPQAPSGGSALTLRVSTNLVNRIFTVRDEHGNLVRHLGKERFSVLDEGNPQEITNFAEEIDGPLDVVIALDKSYSVESRFNFEKRATAEFIRSILRPEQDQALLLAFDETVQLAVPFTRRPEEFAQAMLGLKSEGGTALFDAARTGIERFLIDRGPVRRVLILVTDGEDTVSWATMKDVRRLALLHDVTIYTLGVNPDIEGKHKSDRHDLARLSEDTGGTALFPEDKPEELADLFRKVAEELRNQYSLAYALPPPGGKDFHRVEIKSSDARHRIKTRSGYYYLPGPAGSGQVGR